MTGDATFRIEVEVDAANARRSTNNFLRELKGNTSGIDKDIDKISSSINGVGKAGQGATQSLSNTRYALYDVSTTLATTGVALLGLAVGTQAVAIAWERDFAQVVRTTGVVGDEVGALRTDLVDLAQTMPVAFGDITEIATLAGQLGVAKERVADFTSTVAKFSAVTDLTVDAAATAFGRLDALLPDVQGNYEALGSAIAKVGVNSVATESQIVNISTQISSMGAFAGLTAAEVVGLSGALASVGAAPEISRGTITRLFTEMSKAVSNGGERLQNFAKVSGVSADEFASSFGTSRFGPIFQSFVEGLADVDRNGGNAVAQLAELGVKSVRDVPLLLRLAGAGDVLAQSFMDARDGFAGATELQRQYAIIADTTAAKLKILTNNFMALLDAIGGANLGPLGGLIDGLSGFLGMLTDIASTDLGGRILGIITILTGLLGVLSLAGGALALFGASSIGLQQGLQGIVAVAPRASAAVLGTGTASAIASGQMTGAAVAVKTLSTALKLLGAATVILALPDIVGWANKQVDAMKGFGNELEEIQGRLTKPGVFFDKSVFEEVLEAPQWMNDLNRASADFIGIAPAATLELKKFDDQLASAAQGGNIEGVRDRLKELGLNSQETSRLLPQTAAALQTVADQSTTTATAVEGMDAPMESVEQQAAATEQALTALRDAILNVGATSMSVEATQIALSAAFNQMSEAAIAEGASLDGTNQASLTYRQSLLDMETAARNAATAIIDNGGSVDEATAKYNEGRQALIDNIAAKTGDQASAEEWADKILGTAGEAQAAIAEYTAEVNRVPTTKDTTITNNAGRGPLKDIQFYKDEANRIPPSKNTNMTNNASGTPYRNTQMYKDLLDRLPSTKYTDIITRYSRVGSPELGQSGLTIATGGLIHGPGTGTSDSIPAWVSNGEYVIKAAAVNHYGSGLLNAINSMRAPKFANGGQVGSGNSSASNSGGPSYMTGVVELGPQTMSKLGKEVVNNIMLDSIALSRSVEKGNKLRRAGGDL